jgi:hypothetical protein
MNTIVISSQKELAEWRSRIESAWQKSVQSVIEVGNLVKQAKEQLGVSYTLLETELPFSSTVAAFLIKIAENPVLSNPTYHARLPNGYNTLYYLASVDEKQLVQQIENGEITPNFTLASAKSLREALPKKPTSTTAVPKKPKTVTYVVGSISIAAPDNVDQFQKDLTKLLIKYSGTITHTHKDQSLADWHNQKLLSQALEKISEYESELNTTVSLENMRILEDACFYISKEKNRKYKVEIVKDGELVERVAIPTDYKDYKVLSKLLGVENVTRGEIEKYCVTNKIPNQFTDLKSMDKEIYLWEQARLILEKKDIKGAMKRLKDMSSRSRFPAIRELGNVIIEELNRFSNKA